MILTCPSCVTRFAVADNAFAEGPRKLRCARCRHVWRAGPDGPMPDEPPSVAPSPVVRPAAVSPVVVEPPGPADDFIPPPPAPPLPPPLLEIRHPLVERRPPPLPSTNFLQNMEETAAMLPRLPRRLAWTMIVLLLCGLTLTLFLGRYKLAARFPLLEGAYRAAGLINPAPLESFDLQLTKAEKCFISGRAMLCLAGTVTNRSEAAQSVPTIYVTALDSHEREFTDIDGHGILSWRIPAETGKLLPRETRSFSLTEPYPEKTVTDFDYGFIDDAN
ncbi:MAG: zinc-ribbon domain-containing protein [Alphaproteobacteria bacterium]|nr:zinc-ribbon domain-containing protein [Alphaproteobacteria bacterium]